MSTQSVHRPSLTVWHVMFCLTLVAFLYRLLIPAGFMPDSSALRDGRVVITFCTANSGISAALVNLSDKSDHSSDQDAVTSADCPFGLLAAQAVLPPANVAVLLATVLHHELPSPSYNTTLPPLPAQGPPLGSQAPPLNLG